MALDAITHSVKEEAVFLLNKQSASSSLNVMEFMLEQRKATSASAAEGASEPSEAALGPSSVTH
jgi:hypothetical protein